MKKFLLISMSLAAMAMAVVSCKDYDPQVDYDVSIVGDADGNVTTTFPGGAFELNGKTGIDFYYGKAEVSLKPVYNASDISDPNVLKAYKAVKEDFAKQFGVKAASGTYYLHVKGYATAFGLKIEIDETFTNRDVADIVTNGYLVNSNISYIAEMQKTPYGQPSKTSDNIRFDYVGY